jgi:hypothetical protein
MYALLTGETPFSGDSPMEIALSHISDPPPPPRSIDSSIPEVVEEELLKALSKDPEKRHRTATEFVNAIKRGYGLEDPSVGRVSMASISAAASTSNDTGSTTKRDPKPAARKKQAAKVAPQPGEKTKPGGRLRILFLVVLLAALGVGAFVVLNGLGIITDGAQITLIYNTESFAMINGGDYTLDVNTLQFVRGMADEGGDDFNGYRIARHILPGGMCASLTWQGKDAHLPPQCTQDKTHSSEFLLDPDKFFWRKETATDTPISTFSVMYDGREIARCDTVARGGDAECRFNWPVAPTPEGGG